MKDISNGTIWATISMTSTIIMFIWSFIEGNWHHCWFAPMVGGILGCVITMVRKDKEEAREKRQEEQPKEESISSDN